MYNSPSCLGGYKQLRFFFTSAWKSYKLPWVMLYICLGNCVTTTLPNEVCELNSTSLECVKDGFTAVSCFCQDDLIDSNNTNRCQLTSKCEQWYIIWCEGRGCQSSWKFKIHNDLILIAFILHTLQNSVIWLISYCGIFHGSIPESITHAQ